MILCKDENGKIGIAVISLNAYVLGSAFIYGDLCADTFGCFFAAFGCFGSIRFGCLCGVCGSVLGAAAAGQHGKGKCGCK